VVRIGWCLAIVSLSSAALAHGEYDVVDRLERIPGLSVLEEQPPPDPQYRFFVLSYTQPVDHLDPSRGTFEQLVTLLHRSTRAPTVAFTTGYGLQPVPYLDEPTELVEGNQVSIEERFFGSSIPEPADFSDLTIFQAAADHHRLIEALRPIYSGKWLSTGGSKGGMATVYHRRFFDEDVDGSVVYVAPNDVVNDVDTYDGFLANVGTESCRESLIAIARAALERRDEVVPLLGIVAREASYTFDAIGGIDAGYESSVASIYWSFWQYLRAEDCATVPLPDASIAELADFVSRTGGLLSASDPFAEYFYPYYYQASTQLGWPDTSGWDTSIADLLIYSGDEAVAEGQDLGFDASAMQDIDRWVKNEGHALLFIYGENDPWSAEPFEPGPGTRDSAWYTVAGGNHGAVIAELPASQRLEATNRVRRWAGLEPLDALPVAEAQADAIESVGGSLARAARLQQRLQQRLLPPPRRRL